jgi:hypothetical protein
MWLKSLEHLLSKCKALSSAKKPPKPKTTNKQNNKIKIEFNLYSLDVST